MHDRRIATVVKKMPSPEQQQQHVLAAITTTGETNDWLDLNHLLILAEINHQWGNQLFAMYLIEEIYQIFDDHSPEASLNAT
jgi:hypothetical protein